jgi:hypothetical protein
MKVPLTELLGRNTAESGMGSNIWNKYPVTLPSIPKRFKGISSYNAWQGTAKDFAKMFLLMGKVF